MTAFVDPSDVRMFVTAVQCHCCKQTINKRIKRDATEMTCPGCWTYINPHTGEAAYARGERKRP